MTKKKTVGAIALDLLSKPLETTNPIEQMSEQLSDYEKEFYICLEGGKKEFAGDFYVVVITKKERLMVNVLRNYFVRRASCPTPDYDQTLYKYIRHGDQVELLWCIPDRETCHIFRDNMLIIAPEEKKLLEYVLAFSSGELFKYAKIANGEEAHSNILIQ